MNEEILTESGYRFKSITYHDDGLPLIFLHGYRFTSNIWTEIKALEFLEMNNIPFIALDMPYGMKSECTPKTRDSEANVALIEEVKNNILGKPNVILVGASLGGYMALKFATSHVVCGLLLIAPVKSLEKDLVENYTRIKEPVYIIHGSRDKIVSLKEMKRLSEKFAQSELITYENASHPAYLSNPDGFKKDLLKLYKLVQSLET